MNSNLNRPISKVNFRRYLINRREPIEVSTGNSEIFMDARSGIIKDAQPRKRVFREIARRIRIGRKV